MTTVEGESLFRAQNGDAYRIPSHPSQQSDHEQKMCTVKTETEQQSSEQTTTSTDHLWTASSSVDDLAQRNGLIVSSSELKIKVKVKQEPQDGKLNAVSGNTRKQQIPRELAETSVKCEESSPKSQSKKRKTKADDNTSSSVQKKKVKIKEIEPQPIKPPKGKRKVKSEKEIDQTSKNKADSGSEVKQEKGKRVKKEEQETEVWRWWEEEKRDDSVKWKFLEHKGPVFAPPYEPLPSSVNFYYDGKPMKLSEGAEEVATFYSKMLDHEYTTKDVFNKNFFHDWRKMMNPKERETITDLSRCNFREMNEYFTKKSEERKALSKDEKKKLKDEQEAQRLIYGYAVVDGHKEKIGNYKIEPPGLFRGRGTHPKMGRLKRRIQPEDVIINCSKDAKVPEPPPGHSWKEVRYDNTVTWLASWTENIMGSNKYVMLNPSSKIKGEKDWEKYETARKLKDVVEKIRSEYRNDWKSKEMKVRQRAVALYFIDKLALRAGNEKEDNETADTVGCCSLRCEHIKLHKELDGQQNVVEFDFLGKDSIRYYNRVPVESRVFKNLRIFMEHKSPDDDLFDRLNVTWLASWTENIMGSNKYVMLNPSSKIKGEKDWEKYETARKLKDVVEKIRSEYRNDWKSKEMKVRQRAVALYFIDKLALRAGNEKEDNETADTVGCCSLRCEHIKLHKELDGQQNVVEFDFLGKDSIRYYNRVPVESRVFKNLRIFMEHKSPDDDLFDRLNTATLNKHLQNLMPGLTAKVFRTYNASITLQQQLELLTKGDTNTAERLLAYNRANRQVAILCNHQRSVPKTHGKQMENIQKKIEEKEKQIKEMKKMVKSAKAEHNASGTAKTKKVLEQKKKNLHRSEEQLLKLKVRATDKEENKEIALSTSKLNYLDPRISVAWCKKWDVPIDKIYNRTQREKFRWAIDMAGPEFIF
ncbi:DNA topoisomerase 1 [Trichinella zimbabwensis]|uniref:DNA topoisomerase I n=1 Tax=Trichinella zimbabwensis TaxID=268475 RepID=A0A0V1HJF4_9BILA|nr:DNA topoisomerase 1 [Trichinella zimbabwensis]